MSLENAPFAPLMVSLDTTSILGSAIFPFIQSACNEPTSISLPKANAICSSKPGRLAKFCSESVKVLSMLSNKELQSDRFCCSNKWDAEVVLFV